MADNKSSDEPSHAERGAQVVGELLKAWPTKEAPLAVHIAFCDELRRTLKPFAVGGDPLAKWFGRLDREVGSRLKALRQAAAAVTREANVAMGRIDQLVDQAPIELRRMVKRARG